MRVTSLAIVASVVVAEQPLRFAHAAEIAGIDGAVCGRPPRNDHVTDRATSREDLGDPRMKRRTDDDGDGT